MTDDRRQFPGAATTTSRLDELSSDPTIQLGDDEETVATEAPLHASIELPIGVLFAGRYMIETLLGRGGMGIVYRAKDRLVEDRVALKLLDLGVALPDAREMFRREVNYARRITHSNVVRIHDLAEHADHLFITMQYVEGYDLRREMDRGGKLLPARAARVALDVALALGAAHVIEVVHRDLKPENVLVDGTGRAVLSDFGIARVYDQAASWEKQLSTRVIGTPTYMSPEQVNAEETGPPSDIYTLGVLLYEMLAGTPPFVGENPIAVAVARLKGPAPDIRTVAAVPEPLAALTMACLERQARRRPESAEIVADHLREFLDTAEDLPTTRLQAVRTPAKTMRGKGASRALALPFGGGRISLACLPFAYRGAAEHDYLGEALSGELIDVLSRTKGLRVLASGAVSKIAEQTRDPRAVSDELGVDYVVDGAVQMAGPKLRIVVRLADASGAQLYSAPFDLGFGDLFDMQDEAGQRIAEALRLEVVARSSDFDVPDEAMQLFLQARRILRSQLFLQSRSAVTMLERALTLAPAFTPALASLAIGTVSVWFYPQGDRTRDWEAAAESAVRRALLEASDMVETHVAAARLASHRGVLREAIQALRRATDIAPTSPDAQHLLGQLECETGQIEEGLARLALAHQLEPAAGVYPYEAARAAALRGDHASFDRLMATVRKLQAPLAWLHLELRHASWWNDRARLEAVIAKASAVGAPFDAVFTTVANCYVGNGDPHLAVAVLSPIITHVNPRFGALLRQILVEVHAHAGDIAGALEWLGEAQATVLYDIPWLERCPLLAPLRGLPQFAEIVAEVRARCDAVWASQ